MSNTNKKTVTENNLPNINISNHCYERYHERVKQTDGPLLDSYKPKYCEEIKKLFSSCEKIYNGIIGHSTKPVDVYTNKFGWVFIVGDNVTLITLYKVDLGLGDDFNKEFVKLSLQKIASQKTDLDELETSTKNQKTELSEKINGLENKIKDLNNLISEYKNEIDAYKSFSRVLDTKLYRAKCDLRNTIEGYMVRESARIKSE